MEKVKTRFAPSPTGLMHIGNVRTALYAFLTAKHAKGIFSLRIEDTDRARLVPESEENIKNTLKWLGINWDEDPIYQSKRLDLYQSYAQELLEKEMAYEEGGAIWFKMPKNGLVSIIDVIGQRKIEFDLAKEKDFVILKSDKYPTYHLAHVIDDHLMETTFIIRGEEWISSIPKHVALFQALGWELPQYAHLPVILGTDKSKLSKRHGALPASEYKTEGFLPEALVNYMALLGWTPPSGKEILSLEEMIKEFDLKDVHIAPAVFDITKLEWMNGEYIRKMSDEELTKRLQDFLVDHPAKDKIAPVVPLIKERIKKLSDFVPLTDFLWEKPEYDLEVFNKIKLDNLNPKDILDKIVYSLEEMKRPWNTKTFEETFRNLASELNIPAGSIFQLIRIGVSGQLVTPPLFESIEIIGEDEALNRIKSVTANYPNF